jgi:hypothetical protein
MRQYTCGSHPTEHPHLVWLLLLCLEIWCQLDHPEKEGTRYIKKCHVLNVVFARFWIKSTALAAFSNFGSALRRTPKMDMD